MSDRNPESLQRIEMKFQLDAKQSQEIRCWAHRHLGVDRNCKSDSDDSYDLNTLYLDSSELDVFHHTGRTGYSKHRIRRYGNEQTLWLETKRKKQMVVSKNRTSVRETEYLSRCLHGSTNDWCGNWFFDRITERMLLPQVQIGYRRFARVSTLDGESLRLTIDSQMKARSAQGWKLSESFVNVADAISFADCEILELKFHGSMPWLFKELLRTFSISPTGFSKYRTAMANLGLATQNGEPVHA